MGCGWGCVGGYGGGEHQGLGMHGWIYIHIRRWRGVAASADDGESCECVCEQDFMGDTVQVAKLTE